MDRNRWVVPVALWLGGLIMMPRRLLRGLDVFDVLLHWRVPLVIALGVMITVLVVLRERDKCGQRAMPTLAG
jgi:hypothetical protein